MILFTRTLHSDKVFVNIAGQTFVRANDTAIYTLSIANGPALAVGCDISTSLDQVYVTSLDTNLKRLESFQGSGFELTRKILSLL